MVQYRHRPVRVAIIGPECSGKTTLAQALTSVLKAQGVKAHCVAEYAREYYRDRPYQPDSQDVVAIAREQLAAEQRSATDNECLICDSTVTTCKIWSEVAFGYVPSILLALHRPDTYDLTLLAKPDIPWQADPLRSHPYARDWLFSLYEKELVAHGVRWIEIAGPHAVRFSRALNEVSAIVKKLPKI